MMKLLKYDLKRNATTFLSVGAILIALQLIISIMGNIRGWDPKIILALTIVLYSFVGTFSVILVAITYRKNIKAYSRRLLPQRSSHIIFFRSGSRMDHVHCTSCYFGTAYCYLQLF